MRRVVLAQLAGQVGGSIPWTGQDWANTKAAYRFFSNRRVIEEHILGGHSAATRERIWRGMSRLTDIELGAILGAQLVGN